MATIRLKLVIDRDAEPASSKKFQGIQDVDVNGSIIGIEILSPAHYWGANALARLADAKPAPPVLSVNWDREVDAMYVRLLPHGTRSVRQQQTSGNAWFCRKGHLCLLEVDQTNTA